MSELANSLSYQQILILENLNGNFKYGTGEITLDELDSMAAAGLISIVDGKVTLTEQADELMRNGTFRPKVTRAEVRIKPGAWTLFRNDYRVATDWLLGQTFKATWEEGQHWEGKIGGNTIVVEGYDSVTILKEL
jgi:hypothetical protein